MHYFVTYERLTRSGSTIENAVIDEHPLRWFWYITEPLPPNTAHSIFYKLLFYKEISDRERAEIGETGLDVLRERFPG